MNELKDASDVPYKLIFRNLTTRHKNASDDKSFVGAHALFRNATRDVHFEIDRYRFHSFYKLQLLCSLKH